MLLPLLLLLPLQLLLLLGSSLLPIQKSRLKGTGRCRGPLRCLHLRDTPTACMADKAHE
jgi:hypothetical protein